MPVRPHLNFPFTFLGYCHLKAVIQENVFLKNPEFSSGPAQWPLPLPPPSCPRHILFSSKIKNEDGLFETESSNGPSYNVLLNLSSVNYVVERNSPA